MQPYSDVIIYPDCKGAGMRSLDKPTELFAVITICRHSLHQGEMSFMLKVGESTTLLPKESTPDGLGFLFAV